MTHIWPDPSGSQVAAAYAAANGVEHGNIFRHENSKYTYDIVEGSISASGRLELTNR